MKINMLSDKIQNAYKVMEGEELSFSEALELVRIKGSEVMDLYSLANKVKEKFCSNVFDTCMITNIKSGECGEDCRFCAQSAHNRTSVEVYGIVSEDDILKTVEKVKNEGGKSLCLVASGYGYKEENEDFKKILRLAYLVRKQGGLDVHVSVGILSDKTAALLKKTGVTVVNHNLETSAEFYREICSTHDIEERIATVSAVKKSGMKACSGGILGIGESEEDRIKLAFLLKELDADFIPVNIYKEIQGNRVKRHEISLREILNTLALFRLINPGAVIKLAAGRESVMADFQGLAFMSGANGCLTGGYLTTRGRSIRKDREMMQNLNSFINE